MEPLDLTLRPPRSPYEKLDGLVLLPRTIDKLRSFLPGGNPGEYVINAATMMGISGYLLHRLGIAEDDLRRIVASASDESEVAAWVRAHTDASTYEDINGALTHLRIKHAQDQALFHQVYAPTLAAHPDLEILFDIIEADDRRMWGAVTP